MKTIYNIINTGSAEDLEEYLNQVSEEFNINIVATSPDHRWLEETILHAAVSSQSTQAPQHVRLLLQRGADPTIEDSRGVNPLQLAALHADATMLETLLLYMNLQRHEQHKGEHKMEDSAMLVNQQSSKTGNTALHEVLQSNCIITKKAKIVGLGDGTPFTLARGEDQEKCIELLIEYGANPYLSNQRGKNCFASTADYLIFELLLHFLRKYRSSEGGASLAHTDTGMRKLLTWAFINNRISEITYLLKDNPKLLNERVCSRYLRFYGKTLLHLAAEKKDLTNVKLLVSLGANVNEKTACFSEGGSNGCTALWFAVIAEDIPMVQFLLKSGADINSEQHPLLRLNDSILLEYAPTPFFILTEYKVLVDLIINNKLNTKSILSSLINSKVDLPTSEYFKLSCLKVLLSLSSLGMYFHEQPSKNEKNLTRRMGDYSAICASKSGSETLDYLESKQLFSNPINFSEYKKRRNIFSKVLKQANGLVFYFPGFSKDEFEKITAACSRFILPKKTAGISSYNTITLFNNNELKSVEDLDSDNYIFGGAPGASIGDDVL